MRAIEFIAETKPQFRGITLRQVHAAKHDYKRRKASFNERQKLIPQMYANPGKEQERIELEKARLVLAQQNAELATTEAEVKAETSDAISDMAKAGVDADQQGQSNVSDMARTEMRRRKT